MMKSTPARRLMRMTFAAVLAAVLAACSPIRLFNILIPESGLEATRDVAFGSNPRDKLDVYRPASLTTVPGTAAKPVVVFFYGGAWDSGDKSGYLFVAEALTSRGYVVVIPNYRLYPEVTFPTYMDDAALAVKWTFDNSAQWCSNGSGIASCPTRPTGSRQHTRSFIITFNTANTVIQTGQRRIKFRKPPFDEPAS